MSMFSITLSAPQYADHYVPGERLEGVLTITSEEEVKFKSLDVSLGYMALGRTDDEEVIKTRLLADKPLDAGTHTFGFEFVLPSSPCSHDGEHIEVMWFISAKTNEGLMGMLRSSRADKVEFVLHGGTGDLPHREDEVVPPALDVEDNDYGLGCIIPTGLAGLGLLAFGVWPLIQEGEVKYMIEYVLDSLFSYLFGVFVLCAFVYAFGLMVHRWLASQLFESVSVNLEPWPMRIGSSSLCVVEVMPKRDLMLNEAFVHLSCEEIVTYSDGEGDSTSVPHVVFEQKYVLSPQVELKKGELVRWSALIELPADMSVSFDSSNNEVKWTLQTSLDVPNWPDWDDSHEVQVFAKWDKPMNEVREDAEPVAW